MGGTFHPSGTMAYNEVPNNRILNRALPVNDIGIVIEVLQTAFIILCGLIIVTTNRKLHTQEKETNLKDG